MTFKALYMKSAAMEPMLPKAMHIQGSKKRGIGTVPHLVVDASGRVEVDVDGLLPVAVIEVEVVALGHDQLSDRGQELQYAHEGMG
jgi:hypothetical protein